MPKVYLTQESREAAKRAEQSRRLGEALVLKMSRERKTVKDMAQEAKIAWVSMDKLLHGEEVRLEVTALWRVLEMAGMEVRARNGRGA